MPSALLKLLPLRCFRIGLNLWLELWMQALCDWGAHFKNLWRRNSFILEAFVSSIVWSHKILIVSLTAVSSLRRLPSPSCWDLRRFDSWLIFSRRGGFLEGTQQQCGSGKSSWASLCLGCTQALTARHQVQRRAPSHIKCLNRAPLLTRDRAKLRRRR